MLKTNWKSTALMAGISGVSAILLLSAIVATVDLALFTNVGIGSWLLLLLIAIASSPLTVRVASHDGILRSRESIADSFVLLAVMLIDGTVIDCTGPNTTADNTGGTAGASGNGTTTINVVCPNAGVGGTTPLTTGTRAAGSVAICRSSARRA